MTAKRVPFTIPTASNPRIVRSAKSSFVCDHRREVVPIDKAGVSRTLARPATAARAGLGVATRPFYESPIPESSAGARHAVKEEAMPFDDDRHDQRSDALAKMDKVIALLATEDRWCKFFAESSYGRRCLWGAIWVEDAATILNAPILDAIKQAAGRHYESIDAFNDDPATTHATVLKVLYQARRNMRSAMLSPARRYRWAPVPLGRDAPLAVSFS
jgi:hypothetical protein